MSVKVNSHWNELKTLSLCENAQFDVIACAAGTKTDRLGIGKT